MKNQAFKDVRPDKLKKYLFTGKSFLQELFCEADTQFFGNFE